MRRILTTLALALGFIAGIAATFDEAPACNTDTECAQQCAANDTACDGGPETN